MDTLTPPPVNADALAAAITENFSRILGLAPEECLRMHDSLLDMGADSLALMKCIDFLADELGVSVSIAQLYQEFATVGDIVEHARQAQGRQRPGPATRPGPGPANSGSEEGPLPLPPQEPSFAAVAQPQEPGWIRELMLSHVALMDRQLQMLGRLGGGPALAPAARSGPAAPAQAQPRPGSGLPQSPPLAADSAQTDRFNVFASRSGAGRSTLSPRQQAYLSAFIDAYCARHPGSKQMTQQSRRALADNRASAGFKPGTKEILYPILAERAQGTRLHDVDGNEFIDITMGFGVHLFGHNPGFVREALSAQAEKGFPIGPQSPLAGRVAELVCELTGHERVVFCNSGTEATMTAVRLARAHTGRRKIVVFRESYHGTFDGFLARPGQGGDSASVPVSAGVVAASITDTVVLEYGEDASLERIEALGADLAAVIVEPVQSRRPWLQPRAFLQRLREITRAHGIVFLWDEVITGFRMGVGGAQAHFGIRADLATYGKIAGGGLPIGMVAGDAALLDLIDGGFWQYGDDSFPQADPIFFAGTFTKHPLTMAAAVATLEKIRAEGDSLYPQLHARTERLAQASNAVFERMGVPVRVECFGSLFRYVSRKNIDLFFSHLMMEGVFVWEGRNCFLSTAHTDADVDAIVKATEAAVTALQSGGFLDEGMGAREPVALSAWARRFAGLWNVQAAAALNIGGGIRIQGADAAQARQLQAAIETAWSGSGVCARFDAVAQRWQPSGQRLRVEHATASPAAGETLEQLVARVVDAEMARPFAADAEVQARATLMSLPGGDLLLLLVANHCVCDGYSFALALESIFSGGPAPDGNGQLTVDAEQRYRRSPQYERDHGFWMARLQPQAPWWGYQEGMDLGPVGQLRFRIDADAVARLARTHRVSAFAVLVEAWDQALRDDPRLGSQGVLGIPVANREVLGADHSLVQVSNLLPLWRGARTDARDPATALPVAARALQDLQAHGAYPLLAGLPRAQWPVAMSVNLEPSGHSWSTAGMQATVVFGRRSAIEFPMEANMVRQGPCYEVFFDYREPQLSRAEALSLVSRFEQLITLWSQNAD
jgi:glutamate-1-semialdehyde aminotransferase/acyl carrier protein